jgi:hypothetical protein
MLIINIKLNKIKININIISLKIYINYSHQSIKLNYLNNYLINPSPHKDINLLKTKIKYLKIKTITINNNFYNTSTSMENISKSLIQFNNSLIKI